MPPWISFVTYPKIWSTEPEFPVVTCKTILLCRHKNWCATCYRQFVLIRKLESNFLNDQSTFQNDRPYHRDAIITNAPLWPRKFVPLRNQKTNRPFLYTTLLLYSLSYCVGQTTRAPPCHREFVLLRNKETDPLSHHSSLPPARPSNRVALTISATPCSLNLCGYEIKKPSYHLTCYLPHHPTVSPWQLVLHRATWIFSVTYPWSRTTKPPLHFATCHTIWLCRLDNWCFTVSLLNRAGVPPPYRHDTSTYISTLTHLACFTTLLTTVNHT